MNNEITNPTLIAEIVSLIKNRTDENYTVTSVFKHPVIPGLYGVACGDEWAYVVWLGKKKLISVPDMFLDEPEFPEGVELNNNTWEDENGTWSFIEGDTFEPGETVYPIVFHANIPGGWTVCDASGRCEAYFQSE